MEVDVTDEDRNAESYDNEGDYRRVTVDFNTAEWLGLSERFKPIADSASLVTMSAEMKSTLQALTESVALSQQATARQLAVGLGIAVQAHNERIAANFAMALKPLSEQMAQLAASLTAPYAAMMEAATALDWARISAQSVPVIPNSVMARVARSVVSLPDSQVVAPEDVARRLDLSGIDRATVQRYIVVAVVYLVCLARIASQMVDKQPVATIAFEMVATLLILLEVDDRMKPEDEAES